MNKIKNIVFMGTPDFAIPSLDILIKNNYAPCLVITQPDKPKGRKLIPQSPPVKIFANNYSIPVLQPENINNLDVIRTIKNVKPDLIITVAYGMFLGKELRTLCPYGAINLHPSLLPLHRGADPVRNTLLYNDSICGVSVFFISSKMDSGNIILQRNFNIDDNYNYSELSSYLASNGAEAVLDSIAILERKSLKFKDLKNSFPKQDNLIATYSSKLIKTDTYYSNTFTAKDLNIKVKSYSYEPGFVSFFRNKSLKILKVKILDTISNISPGTIVNLVKNIGFIISTSDYDVLVESVQPEGKKIMTAWEFNIGARIEIGEKIESPV